MVKRFTETVDIRQQNLSTGAAQGIMSLADRLEGFSQQSFQLAQNLGQKEGIRQAADVEIQDDEEGIAQAPEKRKMSFTDVLLTGGAKTKAYNESLRDGYLASLENDLRRELAELELENPDSITQYNEKVQGLVGGVLKGVDPEVRPAVQQFLDRQVTNAQIRIQGRSLETNRREANASRRQAIESAGNEAATLARQGDVEASGDAIRDAFANIDGLVETGDLEADAAAELKRDIEREASEQVIRFNLDNKADAEGIPAAIEEIEEMRNQVPKGWTPDEWDTFVASAQADMNGKQARQNVIESRVSLETSREISNLKIKVKTGQGEPSELIRQTEEFFNQGQINESTRTSLITDIIKQQKETQKDAEAMERVFNRLTGNPEEVVSQEDVDLAWDETLAPSLEGMDAEQRAASIEEFVDSTKVIPTQVKERVVSNLNSGDPNLVAESAGIMDRLDSLRGIPDDAFSPNDRAFAETVVNLSANMEPKEAVDLARRNTDPNDRARVKDRQEIIKEEEFDYAEMIEAEFDPFFGATRVDQINRGKMTQEYQTLFEEHFKAGMDQDAAHRKATQIMKRNWGESSVTGEARAMRHPPEDFYAVGGKTDYIGKQLIEDVKESVFLAEDVELGDIRLVADQFTSRSASSGRPQYIVQVITESDGIITLPDPWMPDMKPEVERQKKENQSRLETMRAFSNDLRSSGIRSLTL